MPGLATKVVRLAAPLLFVSPTLVAWGNASGGGGGGTQTQGVKSNEIDISHSTAPF